MARAPAPVEGLPLSVAAVARRLGVAPATLRTWDRRYGVGPSAHVAGAHRRYSSADLARLELMRQLTLQGVAPSDAARMALAGEVPSMAELAAATSQTKGRGGVVVPLTDAEPAARGLARAAMALDAPTASRIVRDNVREHGVVATWERLLVPVLVGVGERWEQTGSGVDVEHLLSEVVLAALRPVVPAQEQPLNVRPVLLACAEEEYHALPVHAVAAALGECSVGSRVLGARVPSEALASAIRRSGPSAVFVWARLPGCGDLAQLAALPATRPGFRLVVGGPAWDLDPLPAGVVGVSSLAETVEVLRRAALG
jgi:DNA-binding transcriptional MerR regulator